MRRTCAGRGIHVHGSEAAVFAVLLRIMFEADAPGRVWLILRRGRAFDDFRHLGALVQDNVKRLCVLFPSPTQDICWWPLPALPDNGIPAANVLHGFVRRNGNVGAFAVMHIAGEVMLCHSRQEGRRGWWRSPLLAATLKNFLSLIGIPITGGFFAVDVFSAAGRPIWSGWVIIRRSE